MYHMVRSVSQSNTHHAEFWPAKTLVETKCIIRYHCSYNYWYLTSTVACCDTTNLHIIINDYTQLTFGGPGGLIGGLLGSYP